MKIPTIAGTLLLASLFALLLGGCGEQQQQPGPPPPTPQELGQRPAPANPPASSPSQETPPPADPSPPTETPVATTAPEMPAAATASGQSPTSKAKVEPTTEISARVHAMFQSGKRISAQNRLREVALAMHEYHKANQHFPTIDGNGKEPGLSWRVYLLPLLGEEELFQKFHLNEAWDSPHNSTLIKEMPNVFGSNAEGKTRLHLFTGPNAPFQPGKPFRMDEVIDGSSMTIMIAESGEDLGAVWTKPGGLTFYARNPWVGVGQVDTGINVATFDGKVHYLPRGIDNLERFIQHGDLQTIDIEKVLDVPLSASSGANLPAATNSPPVGELGYRYLPAETVSVLTVRTRRLMANPVVQTLAPLAGLATPLQPEGVSSGFKFGSLNLEIDFKEMEEFRVVNWNKTPMPAVVAVTSDSNTLPSEVLNPEAIGAVVRFATPIPFEQVIWGTLEYARVMESEVSFHEEQGIPYLAAAEPRQAIAFSSDHVLLIGSEKAVLAMLRAKNEPIPGNHAITSLPQQDQHMLTLAMNSVPIPLMLPGATGMGNGGSGMDAGMGAAPGMGGPSSGSASAGSSGGGLGGGGLELKNVSLTLDLDHPQLAGLMAQVQSEEQAAMLAGLLQAQVQMGRMLLNSEGNPQLQSIPKPVVGILKELIAGAKVEQTKNQLAISIARPGQFEQLPSIIGRSLSSFGLMPEGMAIKPAEKRELVAALQRYQEEHETLPAVGDLESTGKLSWRVAILPFIGEEELYAAFKQNEAWDSPDNMALLYRMPAIFGDDPDGKTRLHVIVGQGTPFQEDKSVALTEVTDGLESTIMFVEVGTRSAEPWTKPGGLQLEVKSPVRCLGIPDQEVGGYHLFMMDGSERFIKRTISPILFLRMAQHADGKKVPPAKPDDKQE